MVRFTGNCHDSDYEAVKSTTKQGDLFAIMAVGHPVLHALSL